MANALEPAVVYIVDDDSEVREGFANSLRTAGFDARAYGRSEHFLDEVRDGNRSCVILDITTRYKAGREAQMGLKARHSALPVIAISADDDRARARGLGVRLFLRKPVDHQALLDAINWVIGGSAGETQPSGTLAP